MIDGLQQLGFRAASDDWNAGLEMDDSTVDFGLLDQIAKSGSPPKGTGSRMVVGRPVQTPTKQKKSAKK